MARNTFEAWIPEEFDSAVVQRVNQLSVAETYARRVPMSTETKSVPRSAGVDVDFIAKGTAYGEDANENDAVVLTARKFGKAIRVAEEDIDDSLADIVAVKQVDWATSYGHMIDNAAFGATGGTAPFTSVYAALSAANANTNYTAGANIVQTAAGGLVTYAELSDVISRVEGGNYWDEGNVIIGAHPAFRSVLRGVVDANQRPIFIQGIAGTPDTLFGLPVKFSQGLRTSAGATQAPGGNPLLVVFNRNYALLGVRSGPESIFIDGRSGLSALTDESILKMRARRAWAVGTESAFAVLERMP